MNSTKLFLSIALIVGIGLIGYFLMNGSTAPESNQANLPDTDPLDTALEFYNAWHTASLSTSADPYQSNLPTSPVLSEEVSNYIANYDPSVNDDRDPVLCQTVSVPRIGTKDVYRVEDGAQFMVFARGLETRSSHQAIVTVEAVAGEWKITAIECATAETAPEREYSFVREGWLLMSDQPPLQPDTWYVVYEERGLAGHRAPLTFNENSVCIRSDTELACDPESFTNPSNAIVSGELSEAGVTVSKIEFIE